MNIETFQTFHAEQVSNLIRRNLLEINSIDTNEQLITFLVDYFSPTKILENAKTQHIFVALEEGKVIGTAGLANFGNADEPSFYGVAVFVDPDCQGRGIGKLLMALVEAKANELGANKITVRSSISAQGFYKKMGYQFNDGEIILDGNGNYILEKALSSQRK